MLSINHVSLLISDIIKSEEFYRNILNLSPSKKRPELGFPGIWYELGELQIHLLACDNPYEIKFIPEHGGRDRHLALNADSLDEIINRLDQYHIKYTQSHSGRKAVFFRDPDLNVIEIIQIC